MKRIIPGSTKSFTAGAAGSVLWTEAEIPYGGAALKGFFFTLTGTDFDVDSLTRIQVLADNQPIWRVDELQLAQYYSNIGKRSVMAATDVRFPVYFDFLDRRAAAPNGLPLRVQVDYDATQTGACTVQINYILGDAPSDRYTWLMATAMNIAASQTTPVSFPITARGDLLGIQIPDVADVTSLKLWVGERLIWDFPSSSALLASQDYYSGVATTTGTKQLLLDSPEPIVPGTRVELTTAAGFVGATGELLILTQLPHPVPAAA